MSSDVFRRIGRGGAGNFVSQKDLDDAAKAQAKDLEGQMSSPPATEAPPNAPPQYSRGGRGGAGNFSSEPPTVAESLEAEEVVDRTKAVVAASLAGKPKPGLSGRGGMGNWTLSDDKTSNDEPDKQKQQEIEAKITHDVEAGLPMPPKTYHQHDRDVE